MRFLSASSIFPLTFSSSIVFFMLKQKILRKSSNLKKSLDSWDPGGTADENDIVNLRFIRVRVSQSFLNRLQGALKEILVQLLEASSRDRLCHHATVEIFAAQNGETDRQTYFEYAVVDSEYRYVESTAAKIEDQNVPFTASLFVEAVSNSGGSRLVNDPQDIQAGDSTGVLGSLPLGIVEVRRYRNHRVRHGLSQISFRRFLHFRQDHRRDLLGKERLRLVLEPLRDPRDEILTEKSAQESRR
ncbi:NAD-specific glutamate dehydrogenase [Habropoda laboriosa]|uniref:NAD-specific glutamate dehydrogenase n=1 Tax=Habropoda laboriosa TaxID=597456 RepID=A0A0L7R8L1_9HYME|nr:NAD-specific glutamate dehydrogenase [Habropoda laboriosa]